MKDKGPGGSRVSSSMPGLEGLSTALWWDMISYVLSEGNVAVIVYDG